MPNTIQSWLVLIHMTGMMVYVLANPFELANPKQSVRSLVGVAGRAFAWELYLLYRLYNPRATSTRK